MDSYEKKYKEALEKARQLCAYPTSKPFISDLQDLFPELTESNDERIRKELIDAILGLWDNDALPMPLSVKRKDEWIAWLEKQGNKTAWSEEDEVRLQACLDTLQAKSLMGKVDTIMTEWLKSLKDRVQPIHEYSDTEKQEMFIRSQRPHFWKPTDKQMDTLLSEVTGWTKGCPKQKVLESFYNDLKKLREGEL